MSKAGNRLAFSIFSLYNIVKIQARRNIMKKNTEYVFDDEKNDKYEFVVTRRKKKKKGHPILTALIVLFVFAVIGSGSNDSEPTAATNQPLRPAATSTATPTTKPTEAPTATATATPTAKPTAKPTDAPTATPTSTPTATPTAKPTATPFTVEHDEEYYATQEYIYKFLRDKGYEVRTIIGVPDIGRLEGDDTDDMTVPWYAYVMYKGEWTQFNVLLFNGEVSFIRPVK
jgi:hypothetical protein